ncbi:hypothetical protein HK405_009766 [Cladochytrium tenue]|nr:hypothetical protein HK405_009766 [Cladochytrium tenue]
MFGGALPTRVASLVVWGSDGDADAEVGAGSGGTGGAGDVEAGRSVGEPRDLDLDLDLDRDRERVLCSIGSGGSAGWAKMAAASWDLWLVAAAVCLEPLLASPSSHSSASTSGASGAPDCGLPLEATPLRYMYRHSYEVVSQDYISEQVYKGNASA